MSAIPLAKETTFEALGQRWTLGRWSLKVWDDLRELAKPHLANPYEGLKDLLPCVDRELARELVLQAQKAKRRMHSIGSPEIQEWLETIEGKLSLFYVLLKARHPDMTPELAMQIVAEVGDAAQAQMLAAANGEPPPAKNPLAPAA
jgi:hypothetical protein